jgi:hypothetical protein
MKKYILLLLTTIAFGQTYQNPTYGTLTLKTNVETTTATKINAQETDGKINWLQPINIPIPTVPTNYSVLTPTLGGHLNGIDAKLGTVTATTAGVTTRVWFTADVSVVSATNYYATNATGKGTLASAIQSVVNNDNEKKYFTQDLIGAPFAANTLFPPGVYAGNLSASTTPNSAQQRWTVELYRCNNAGTPIASGVIGAVVGSLGVTTITVLDSGLLTLADGSVTNVQVSGNLGTGGFSILTGERIRYHVSAEKVGTAASNITQSVYYGTSFNSFLDVPVPLNTSGVQNLSTVTGQTTTEALNNLNILKANLINPTFSGLTVSSNAIGTSTNKISQIMGGSDIWSIYGTDSGSDKGILVFELGDDGFPIGSLGEGFEFRYNASATGVAKTPFTIDYNKVTVNADLVATTKITITTSVSITTSTLDANGYGQDGKHVVIDNGVNVINLTCNGGVTTSYGKTGTGAITFVQGSGRTLVQLSGTAVFNGIAGSTATLWSNGTTDYLSINNY